MDIYILFRDMRTYGFREDYYREAADKGVRFIRWEPEDKPRVEATTEEGMPVLRVTVADPILGQRLAIDARFAGPVRCRYSLGGQYGNRPVIQGRDEPGWFFPGSPCKIKAR